MPYYEAQKEPELSHVFETLHTRKRRWQIGDMKKQGLSTVAVDAEGFAINEPFRALLSFKLAHMDSEDYIDTLTINREAGWSTLSISDIPAHVRAAIAKHLDQAAKAMGAKGLSNSLRDRFCEGQDVTAPDNQIQDAVERFLVQIREKDTVEYLEQSARELIEKGLDEHDQAVFAKGLRQRELANQARKDGVIRTLSEDHPLRQKAEKNDSDALNGWQQREAAIRDNLNRQAMSKAKKHWWSR